MRLALQRAATARECVEVMGQLVAEHGYRSSGESFCIGDPHEAWIMEMVGPGPGWQGAHWVALRVPDGCVSAFANLGRIGTFPTDDPENCLYSPGIAEFAAAQRLVRPRRRPLQLARRLPPGRRPEETLHRHAGLEPLPPRGAVAGAEPRLPPRRRRAPSRTPCWIKPDAKLTTADVFALMRDHYEGTPYDMTRGVDAGPHGNPVRWRPMGFEVDGGAYTWERPISTQQTGFSMVDPVARLAARRRGRRDLVRRRRHRLHLLRAAVLRHRRGAARLRHRQPGAVQLGLGLVGVQFRLQLRALRYDAMIVDVRAVQGDLEGRFLALQPAVEQTAAALHAADPVQAIRYLTDYSVTSGERVVRRWRELGEELLTRYNDGYVRDADNRPQETGYPEDWLRTVVRERPEQFRLPADGNLTQPSDY